MTEEFKPKPAHLNTAGGQPTVADEAVRKIMASRIKTFNPWRRTRITEWNANIAYLCGHQYIGVSGNEIHSYSESQLSPFATTVNKILPAVRNDIAMATKVPPKFDVVPDTTDDDDRATAITGEKMLSYLRRLNNFDAQRGKLILWYDIANVGWRKIYWDPFYKVIGTNPEPEQEGHDPEMEPGQVLYQGEVISKHVSTNELVYDWRQDRKSWMIHARPMTRGDIEIIYGPEKAATVPDSFFGDAATKLSEFEIKINTEFSNKFGGEGATIKPDTSDIASNDEEAMVYEMWQERDAIYPMGVFAVMVGAGDDAIVLANQPYPIEQYPHGELPFIEYAMMEIDKAVSGSASRISQVRPLQRELNDIRTLIRENTATLGGGLWMTSREAKIEIKRLDNRPGLIVEYDGVYKPSREAGVPVSGQLFAHAAIIAEDMNDIFSFPPVSQGKRPTGGPKSGIGIGLLQETAQTQHSPMINEMDRIDERAARQLLSVAFANYKQERTFQIVGKDNQWALFEFDPSSFTTNFNVNVQTGSSMPISKAVERELTLGLLQMGVLGNPMDPTVRRRVLETIDIGGVDKILKDNAKDTCFAKLEFLTPVQQYKAIIEQGAEVTEELLNQIYLPTINPFDNHEVHIVEHKKDLMDHFFEYLGSGDPGLLMIAHAMQEHWAEHAQILQEMQLQQALLSGEIKRADLEPKEKTKAKE